MENIIIIFSIFVALGLIAYGSVLLIKQLVNNDPPTYNPDHNAFKEEDNRQIYDDWTGLN